MIKNRQVSSEWWDSLESNPLLRLIKHGELTTKYFGHERIPKSLTGREIQIIWNAEKG